MSEKPSLSGILVAAKGEAARPRAEYVPPGTPASTPTLEAASVSMLERVSSTEVHDPQDVVASPRTFKSASRALTLRLDENVYQELRAFSFERNRTHQDVMSTALIEYLKRQNRKVVRP